MPSPTLAQHAGVLFTAVAMFTAPAAGQECETLPAPSLEGAIHIDLSRPGGTWVIERDVMESIRVVVSNINPFSGRYKVKVGEAQLLPDRDPVQVLTSFLQFAYPGLAALSRIGTPPPQEVKGRNWMGIRSPAAPSCRLASWLQADYLAVTAVRDSLDRTLRQLSETAEQYDTLIADGWRNLRAARESSGICSAQANVRDTIEVYLKRVRPVTAKAHQFRLRMSAIAAQMQARATAAASVAACSGAAHYGTVAAEAVAIAEEAEEVIQQQRLREGRLDTILAELRSVPSDGTAYSLIEVVPLQSKPAAIDVLIARAPLDATGDEAYRTVAARRIRFEKEHDFTVGIGVGAYFSSIPTAEYSARQTVVAGPGTVGDMTVWQVAVEHSHDSRFVPAAVAAVGLESVRYAHILGGVGLNPTGEPTANYILGFSVGVRPLFLSAFLTAAETEVLGDGLGVGGLLANEAALTTRSEMRLGFGAGITLLLR